jgi:predicted metallo-beta-lactamase superfamily hydrolase
LQIFALGCLEIRRETPLGRGMSSSRLGPIWATTVESEVRQLHASDWQIPTVSSEALAIVICNTPNVLRRMVCLYELAERIRYRGVGAS